MKSFASDNYSPVSPEVLSYLSEINTDHASGYGNDPITKRAKDVVNQYLGTGNADVHFMMTGTGSNILILKHVLKSTQSVLLPNSSHLKTNESGGPEAISHCKLLGVNQTYGKIDLVDAQSIIDNELEYVPHAPRPSMVSIAQSTEYGTVYTLNDLAEIRNFASNNNLYLHVDMCRVYNAAVFLGVEISQIIDACKPDIISLGGTKNGLMFAEAIVILNDELKDDFEILQKQSMQLYSKMRYLSGQFIPFFEKGLYKQNSQKANSVAFYFSQKLRELGGLQFTVPVETNHLFLILPKEIIPKLQAEFPFYVWNASTNEVRLVTSWDNTEEEVDRFVGLLADLL